MTNESSHVEGLLQSTIQTQDVSDAFKMMAKRNGYTTIQELITDPVNILMRKPEFSYHIYQELANLLQGKGLIHLLKHE